MNIFNIIIFLFIVSCSNVQSAENETQSIKPDALEKVLQERNASWYKHATKFGDLKFLLNDGSLGVSAKSITLNDKTLISVKNEKDAQGGSVYLMKEDMRFGSIEYEPRVSGQSGPKMIKRMIVLVGPDGNCVKQFLILDFSEKIPFVSERFGYNPQDQSCLSFKRAKWGKNESYIYLDGPMTYIYNTGGRVIGPI